MTRLILLLTFLTTTFCFGQNESELFEKAEFESMNRNYQKAIELYNKLIAIADTVNLDGYYYNRAEAKYNIRDYKGAMEDVSESLKRRDNFCSVLYLSGRIKLKFGDRKGACNDFHKANNLCKDQYNSTIETECDNSWDYDKVYKIYCNDTSYIETTVSGYYIGCKEKVVDTLYSGKNEINFKGNDWEIYYDKQFKKKLAEFYTRNDTLYKIYYYRNGQRKREDRTVDYIWVYNANWCENGQLISQGIINNEDYRTDTTYYCNGKKKWNGNVWKGRTYGIETRWYENGQKKSEKIYSEFNQELANKGELIHKLLRSQFWDENGNEVPAFQDRTFLINNIGAPIILSSKQLNGASAYYKIKGQKEYDNTMNLFKEIVYKNTKLKFPCKCNFGLVYITFLVTKEGKISNVQIETSLEECIDNSFVEAIKNINNWTPGKINGQAVDVLVEVGLELEKIVR